MMVFFLVVDDEGWQATIRFLYVGAGNIHAGYLYGLYIVQRFLFISSSAAERDVWYEFL